MNTPAHICPHCGQATGPVIVGITAKMLEAVRFIAAGINADGFPPSFEQIRVALGIKSKNGVWWLLTRLEERGWIVRQKNRARSTTLTDAAWAELSMLPEKKAA